MNARLTPVVLLVACSGAPLPADFQRAQSLESTDPERARTIYEAIDTRCKTEKLAHDDCGQAAERLAELNPSVDAWLHVVATTTEPRRAARALQRAAELGRDPALAWRCVEEYPDEIAAGDALKLAIRIDEPRDWSQLAARLGALYPRVVKFDIGDNVLYEHGMLLARHDERDRAVAIFDQLADDYPHSSLRDDGLWRAAELLRGAGDFEGALKRLRRITSTKRKALITGSYNYLQLDDAQLLIGRIYLDDLHDSKHAAEAFEKLADDYPDSTLRDDALYDLARARRVEHDDAAACRALGRLVKQFPDGNRVRAAQALMREVPCP